MVDSSVVLEKEDRVDLAEKRLEFSILLSKPEYSVKEGEE